MAILIGKRKTGNYGEDYFISKALEYLDDSYVIYRNRQLYGKEFDVCILMPNKGLLIVELKGWREETILRVDGDSIVIKTGDGEMSSSPQKQARGYRYSIERFIKNSIELKPLVFQMVCFPQVSQEYYHAKRLDIVAEEKFTILKEDLTSNAAFFKKIDDALKEANHWYRDSFDEKAMHDVRKLFEPDYSSVEAPSTLTDVIEPNTNYDYSRLYYFQEGDSKFRSLVSEMVREYRKGCKLYCVFSNYAQLEEAVSSIDDAIHSRGLIRNRDNLEIAFNDSDQDYPSQSAIKDSFSCFHCSFSLLREAITDIDQSFCIINGKLNSHQRAILESIDRNSGFNSKQYLIEHASPQKNIVVKAGAGTGKTYTMISRIGFICYSQNAPLIKMADRITMITFTNEAANNMGEKLKAYFRNCYLLTSKIEYLDMVSLIDHMQISTIHSYAKNIITKLGTEFGYGIDLAITSSEYNRRQKISEYIDAYISRQEQLHGDYLQRLGLPAYAICDLVLDFTKKLNNKSISISDLSVEDFGTVSDPSRTELHNLLANVIPNVDREFNEELLKDNRIHLSSMMSVLNHLICSKSKSSRVTELKGNNSPKQFMFVDEFQDTDDSQIEILLELAKVLNYKLFLVGDIKQCIYRFRGAKEKAFDQLNIESNPSNWQ